MRSRFTFEVLALLCASLLVLALPGCSDDTADGGSDTGSDAAGDTETQVAVVNIATFNAGLALNFVQFAEERQAPVADAIGASDYDILCLQEVWNPSDIEAVTNAAGNTYPYSYWADTTNNNRLPPACTAEETADLIECITDNDCENDAAGLITCALSNCGAFISGLSTDCLGCVGANSSGSVDDVQRICVVEGGPEFRDEGRNGVLLLSQHEISNPEHQVLDGVLVFRVALHAQVDLPDIGPVEIYCTHLATEDPIPYNGPHAGYQEQQAFEIGQLTDWITETSGGNPVVILGDFNTGPELSNGISGEWPENFAMFEAAGYTNPFVSQDDAQCTYCAENLINDTDNDRLIDHLFFGGWSNAVVYDGERVFDDSFSLETDTAGTVDSHLSDHFGIVVEVTVPIAE